MRHYATLMEIRLQTVSVAPKIRFTLVLGGSFEFLKKQEKNKTRENKRTEQDGNQHSH